MRQKKGEKDEEGDRQMYPETGRKRQGRCLSFVLVGARTFVFCWPFCSNS